MNRPNREAWNRSEQRHSPSQTDDRYRRRDEETRERGEWKRNPDTDRHSDSDRDRDRDRGSDRGREREWGGDRGRAGSREWGRDREVDRRGRRDEYRDRGGGGIERGRGGRAGRRSDYDELDERQYESFSSSSSPSHPVSRPSDRYKPIGEFVYGSHSVLAALSSRRRAEFHRLFIQQADTDYAAVADEIQDQAVEEDSSSSSSSGSEPSVASASRRPRSTDPTLRSIESLMSRHYPSVPIHYVSKQVLNFLTLNRPHNGFVLDASPLRPLPLLPSSSPSLPPSVLLPGSVFLLLDSIQDPQNLGAILRSAYYLHVDGVIVCEKNSAELSGVVSKASSGAMELMRIWGVGNAMAFLKNCRKQREDTGGKVMGLGEREGEKKEEAREKEDKQTEREKEEGQPSESEQEEHADALSASSNFTSSSPLPSSSCSTSSSFFSSSSSLNWRLIGMNVDRHAIPCSQLRHESDAITLIIVGNEGEGIRTLLKQQCDASVMIEGGRERRKGGEDKQETKVEPKGQGGAEVASHPVPIAVPQLRHLVDSLNVSSAVAVALYQVVHR